MFKRTTPKKKNIKIIIINLCDKFLEWSFKQNANKINKHLNGK
jgi:hypothetical protein